MTTGIVVSIWPSAIWFPLILRMTVELPILLASKKNYPGLEWNFVETGLNQEVLISFMEESQDTQDTEDRKYEAVCEFRLIESYGILFGHGCFPTTIEPIKTPAHDPALRPVLGFCTLRNHAKAATRLANSLFVDVNQPSKAAPTLTIYFRLTILIFNYVISQYPFTL
ncbi:hypothetical protein PHYBLDRAFT_139014 [Phycomyces blakesleeanus NRRL 1555(-)]|uniref:Uncharacterized protein n=1 Tax=Phycomyces blakesleeanus (strain ATCC 8743b / DSM 1359 / FGSC 10004 / NBRC 33097 / NRRL 1555) TaxID=763407 RepID=A0A162VBQ0_PHYB8|nr:hypothetical protein PHYBLDRAFT_139014 [Phycomyces blakesleeanus NRRL 1555(-)]OAD81462.1 hypothetical protein PHYBLDRAFT_139014 [Phycomyces blakesleeanus NRRL 1555(-)]|eukprot:XP_018299502.1 hypothetical protein PHYBLDRAFT_139014 [Phycomyces blakesleeanus NRRL 1555(-)]